MLKSITAEVKDHFTNSPLGNWNPLLVPGALYCSIDFLPQGNGLGASLAMMIISSLLAATLMSHTHRIILLGPQSVHPLGIPTSGTRLIRYFMYSLCIDIVIGVVALMLTGAVSLLLDDGSSRWLLFPVAGVIATGIGSRLCLVLPATSVDSRLDFPGSWAATRNTEPTAYAVFILIPIALIVPTVALAFQDEPIFGIAWSLASTVMLVAGVVFLSVYYRQIMAHDASSTF